MGLILLEALAAGLLFIGIVWWTMFSGRKKGELHEEDEPKAGTRRTNKTRRRIREFLLQSRVDARCRRTAHWLLLW